MKLTMSARAGKCRVGASQAGGVKEFCPPSRKKPARGGENACTGFFFAGIGPANPADRQIWSGENQSDSPPEPRLLGNTPDSRLALPTCISRHTVTRKYRKYKHQAIYWRTTPFVQRKLCLSA